MRSELSRRNRSATGLLLTLAILSTIWVCDARAVQRPQEQVRLEADHRGAMIQPSYEPALQNRLDRAPAWQAFLQRNPGSVARWDDRREVPERVLSSGLMIGEVPYDETTAAGAARRFLGREASAWIDTEDLSLVRSVEDERGWWVQFSQTHRGLRVVDARATLRIGRGGEVPVFGLMVHPEVSGDVVPRLNEAQAHAAAIRDFPSSADLDPLRTELVVLPVESPSGTRYHLAYEIEFLSTNPHGSWVSYVDAKDGALLWRYDRLYHVDITGQATGSIEPVQVNDLQEIKSFKNLTVSIVDGTTVLAEATSNDNGFYTLTEVPEGEFTFSAPLAGPYARVFKGPTQQDLFSLDPALTPVVTSSVNTATVGNLPIFFDDTNTDVQDRDAFYWTTRTREFVESVESGFHARVGFNYQVPIATDLQDASCNAFWNGLGITFFPEGDGCSNTARSASVVIHEYGHGVTDWKWRPFSASGAMHEGFSDYISATILNDPIIGHGFFGQGSSLRTIDNTNRWPDDVVNEVHADGLIIGGALWDVREVLGATKTDELWHFAGYGLSNNYDDYFVDFLVTDDDDANIYNGTPNFDAIVTAFRDHGIGDYSIQVAHAGLPDTEDLAKTFDLTATFLSLFALEDGTVQVHYEIENGGTTGDVVTEDLTATSGIREFTFNLEAQPTGTEVRYWFTAEDIEGTTVTYPSGGSTDPFNFLVGPDTVKPEIVHETLLDQPIDQAALRLLAKATDNLDLGIGSVDVSSTQGGGEALSTSFTALSADRYEGLIPFDGLALGDLFEYRIEAVDLAASPNTQQYPEAGPVSFEIVRGLGRDFEADNGGLTASDGTWSWGDPTFFADDAYSGTNVWATSLDGAYLDGSSGTLDLGPLDLSEFTKAALTFRHAYDIESFWDGGTVLVSEDGGTVWSVLIPDGEYPFSQVFSLGLPGFSGRQSDWTLVEFDLTNQLGSSDVRFRFEFKSDQGLTGPGWYIDDLQIVERQVLGIPLRLAASSGRDSSIPLSWEAPAGIPVEGSGSPLLGYNVYRSEGADYAKLNDTAVLDASFTDDTAVNGTFYDYKVTGIYEDGESPLSSVARAIAYVAGYQAATTEITEAVDEGGIASTAVSITNSGTGFLSVNPYVAATDQDIDDVRIRYDLTALASKPGAERPARSIRRLEPLMISPDQAAGARAALKRALGLPSDASAGLEVKGVERSAAIPPQGSYELLFVDGADAIGAPETPDLQNLEAQFDAQSIYFKITSHRAWGDWTTFSTAVAIDIDDDPSTGAAIGDVALVAGAIPSQFVGAPAVLFDADQNVIGIPHHIIMPPGGTSAEWGFFLPALGETERLNLTAVVLPAGPGFTDLLPNPPAFTWLQPGTRHLDVFQTESEDLDVFFDATGLDPARYEAQILLETNDPLQPVVALPTAMDVLTPVQLLAMRAETADLGVRLSWETAEETNHLGFHVFRSVVGGAEQRVTNEPLLADGTGRYVFEDLEVIDGVEYEYRVADLARNGEMIFHAPVRVRYLGATALVRPVLRRSMPNPVQGSTTIRFGLPNETPVSLRVYSVQGKLVRTLIDGQNFSRGFHELRWDGRDDSGRRVSAGFYTLRLEAARNVMNQKLVVVQ